MDTGYVHLLDDATRRRVLAETRNTLGGGEFVAGAFVADRPGDALNLDAYRRAIDAIQEHGGLPILFQSHGLISHCRATACSMPTGPWDAIVRGILPSSWGRRSLPSAAFTISKLTPACSTSPACIGAKHSSLEPRARMAAARCCAIERRPDFLVLTGNDLAIDMIKYGSDYLLGLSTFAPDLFARRDALWAAGDAAFYELNDVLQYLGFFAFRPPVPAYKHSAAQFLKQRGWISCDNTHPQSPQRPASDHEILRDIAHRLSAFG